MNDVLEGLSFYAVFIFAVTVHEAAHAWAAKRGGDLTAYQGGQVTLDPVPHMKREPFGMVILPLITVFTMGFPMGFASAPYDPTWARLHPRRAAWMALAGPGANLGLVILCGLLIRGGMLTGHLEIPDRISAFEVASAASGEPGLATALAFVLSLAFAMNLLLFVLNMLPFPPLDGSGALPLLLPRDWVAPYQDFVQQPMLGWIGILIAWQLFSEVFSPVLFFSIGLLYPEVQYG